MNLLKFSAVSGTLALSLISVRSAHALGEAQRVFTERQANGFELAEGGHCASLYVADDDWAGVRRAVGSFAGDMQQVTGCKPEIVGDRSHHASQVEMIMVGTLGHSPVIDRLAAQGRLDVSRVRGRWETSVTEVVEHPMPGVRRALLIVGADKRGSIFGLYDLSEQIGVSPWGWWADVPVTHKNTLYVMAAPAFQPEPRVKYRGIFLNDEAPALSGWTREKFGGFNHTFYEHVFELLLRLKANFLWPAMWGSAFNEDDPLDRKLADEYGIVMGTSHHEPMMRAQQEWKRHGQGAWDYTTNAAELDSFWREGVRRNKNYEQLTTVGMRGDGDLAMSSGTNTELLEKVVAAQRKVLSQEVNPDVTKVPQVWALYKEVQEYYEKGMRVPDDVTLLWSDDNWGNLRRLPTAEERQRPGGAGIYYHFDYVGGPRSYKWLNTYSITKVSEQMNLALEYGADRMWIVNVGDLKPMEFPIEFFLDLARTPERWGKDHLDEFTELWAAREFGPEHAVDIAALVSTYTKYNARRKPEQLEPTTFSLVQDNEADRVDHAWRSLVERAEHLNTELPEAYRPAFFQLVLYPLKASAVVNEMYIAAGRNQLYARQGRASANAYAEQTRHLFAEDAALSEAYNHKLLAGKWDHMMDQTHIGYTFWNEPPVNAMPAVTEVQPLPGAHMGVVAEASLPFRPALPVFDSFNHRTRTLDIFNRGTERFRYSAETSAPWIRLSETQGEVSADTRIGVSIDWAQAPVGTSRGEIVVKQADAAEPPVRIAVSARKFAPDRPVRGFVEDGGVVAIEAEHTAARREVAGIAWQPLPGFGETLSGMEAFPVTAPSTPGTDASACLDYDFYVFEDAPRTLQAVLAPTLSFAPGRGLRYEVGLDRQPAVTVDAWKSNTPHDWETAVSDGVHRVASPLGNVSAGAHTLHFCRVDPGVVLERLVVYSGKTPSTYLGPPESARGESSTQVQSPAANTTPTSAPRPALRPAPSSATGSGQDPSQDAAASFRAAQKAIAEASAAGYQRMMDQLRITSLRRGADGNAGSAFAANWPVFLTFAEREFGVRPTVH